MKNDVIEKR